MWKKSDFQIKLKTISSKFNMLIHKVQWKKKNLTIETKKSISQRKDIIYAKICKINFILQNWFCDIWSVLAKRGNVWSVRAGRLKDKRRKTLIFTCLYSLLLDFIRFRPPTK